ncbi:MAG: HhH-GPD-type base excision DNA repair protein, partial [Mycobacteriales bacterium]
MALTIAQDPAADELLSRDPLALLIGMVLDQQFPMERAFASPYLLTQRLGTPGLDARQLAEMDADELARLFAGPPALHRFPGSMAGRVQAVCRHLVEDYSGDAAALWTTASSGAELLERIESLPGFGKQKARIFLALLGKQCGVRPEGWRDAAGPYGLE